MLRLNQFASPGLLQLTAMCLAGFSGVGFASSGFNSTTAKPPPASRDDAFQPAAASNSSTGMFTFNQPGRSFVEYRHVWPSLKSALRVSVRLRFRTTRPVGILTLLSSVSDGPPTVSNATAALLPTTLIRLHRGSIYVSVRSSRDQNKVLPAQSGIVVGKGRSSLLITFYSPSWNYNSPSSDNIRRHFANKIYSL